MRLDASLTRSATRGVRGVIDGGPNRAASAAAGIGRSLEGIGGAVDQFGAQLDREAQAAAQAAAQQKRGQNALQAVKVLGEFDTVTDKVNADYASGFDGSQDLAAQYETDFNARKEALLGSFGADDKDLRDIVALDLERSFQRGRVGVAQTERKLRTEQTGRQVQEGVDSLVNNVRGGAAVDVALARLQLATAAVDEVAREQINQIAVDQIYQAFAAYNIENDPREFHAQLAAGDFDDRFAPALKNQALRSAKAEIDSQDREAASLAKEQERKRLAAEKERQSLARLDLQFEMTDHLASVTASGQGSGLTYQRVLEVSGEKAAKRFQRSEAHARDMFSTTADMPLQSRDEIMSTLAGAAPRPGEAGFADKQQVFEQAQSRAKAILQQRQLDPAGAAQAVPAVQELAARLSLEGATPDDVQKYAQAVLEVQEDFGIAASDQRILRKGQAEDIVGQFETSAPQDYRELLNSLNAYGALQPRIMGELVEAGLPDTVEPIWSLSANPNAQTAMISALKSDKDNKATLPRADVKKTETAVDASLAPLFATLASSPDAARLRSTYAKSTQALARQYVAQGASPSDAAQRAASAFTAQYEFEGSYRIPVTRDVNHVTRGVDRIMGAFNPRTAGPRGRAGALGLANERAVPWWGLGPQIAGQSDAARQEQYGKSISRHGRWITNEDESGLALVINGGGLDVPVLDKNDNPVNLVWDDLEAVGGGFTDFGGVRFTSEKKGPQQIADLILRAGAQ